MSDFSSHGQLFFYGKCFAPHFCKRDSAQASPHNMVENDRIKCWNVMENSNCVDKEYLHVVLSLQMNGWEWTRSVWTSSFYRANNFLVGLLLPLLFFLGFHIQSCLYIFNLIAAFYWTKTADESSSQETATFRAPRRMAVRTWRHGSDP